MKTTFLTRTAHAYVLIEWDRRAWYMHPVYEHGTAPWGRHWAFHWFAFHILWQWHREAIA